MNQRRRLLNLKVRAYDLGAPSLHSEVEVRIFVLDRNDHGPKFEKDLYTVNIPEDIEGGTPIIKVGTRRKNTRSKQSIFPNLLNLVYFD